MAHRTRRLSPQLVALIENPDRLVWKAVQTPRYIGEEYRVTRQDENALERDALLTNLLD